MKTNELAEAMQNLLDAISLPEYTRTVDFEYPEKTYDKSYGGGDCSKHGRYYGICHSCNRDYERAKKDADREVYWQRKKAIDIAVANCKIILAKATGEKEGVL